jgi:hypothetical protein
MRRTRLGWRAANAFAANNEFLFADRDTGDRFRRSSIDVDAMECVVAGGISSGWRRLLMSCVMAVLLPVLSIGVLGVAAALAGTNEVQADSARSAPKPAPVRHAKRHTLPALGRATAIAWVGSGHLGH